MKIVAILEGAIAGGGGFNQSLNALQQMGSVCKDRFDFEVLTTRPENVAVLERLGIPSQSARIRLLDTLLVHFGESAVWRAFQVRARYLGPLERRLIRMGCDLVYFVSPSSLPAVLQRLNFIATVWDLCHRDFPEFPEVRSFGESRARDRMFGTVLPSAYTVISDSEALAVTISQFYGIDRRRIIAMPFSPAPHMRSATRKSNAFVFQKYDLRAGYFFYPAQLWPHKNHARVLHAASILLKEGIEIDLIFAGGDKGELGNLLRLANKFGLDKHVRFLGFVPDDEMDALYQGCHAVVMPTYFGPTNLPPLEAWSAKRPLIYSRHLEGQVGDAAILIDPDDAVSLASGMRESLDEDVAKNLVECGNLRLAQIESDRAEAESRLAEAIQRFWQRRQCWA